MAANIGRRRTRPERSARIFTGGVRRGVSIAAFTAGIVGVITLGAAAVINPVTAAPKGNNGTVKIANVGDVDGIPDNNPHVGCTFTIEWYNFDVGNQNASVSFTMQSPTTGAVAVGGGDTTPTIPGGPGLDKTVAYTLTPDPGIVPQPNQGYHVKVTVTTPNSKGNDTKSKTFWFAGCSVPTTEPTEETTPPTEETTEPTEETTLPTEETSATATTTATQPQPGHTQHTAHPTHTATATSTPTSAPPAPADTTPPNPPTRIESGLTSVSSPTESNSVRFPLLALSGLLALLGAAGLRPRRGVERD